MSLRWKVILYVGLTITVAVAVMFLFFRFFLLDNYTRLEQREVGGSINRVKNSLNNRLAEISRTTGDYATWDDTYQFIKDRNQKFINSNLTADTFTNLKLNFMVFIDPAGQVVEARYFDLANNRFIPFPPELLAKIAATPSLVQHQSVNNTVSGLLLLPQSIYLITARPIITSLRQGPVRGAMLFGRVLDQELSDLLMKTVDLSIVFQPINDQTLPADFKAALAKILSQKSDLIVALSGKMAAGYSILNDLENKPALIVRVDVQRIIYQQGQNTVLLLNGFILIFGGLLLIIIIYFVEHTMLARLTALSHKVSEIGRTGDLTLKVPAEGGDELASLGSDINQMLAVLKKAQLSREEFESRFEVLFEAIPEAIYLEGLDGKIIDCNAAVLKLTGYTKAEMLQLQAAALVPEEQAKHFPELISSAMETGQFFLVGENKRKNGEVFPVEVGGTLIEINGAKHLLVVVHDITERKAMADQVQEKVRDLEEFHDLAVGRELRLIELEKELERLRQ